MCTQIPTYTLVCTTESNFPLLSKLFMFTEFINYADYLSVYIFRSLACSASGKICLLNLQSCLQIIYGLTTLLQSHFRNFAYLPKGEIRVCSSGWTLAEMRCINFQFIPTFSRERKSSPKTRLKPSLSCSTLTQVFCA